MTPPTALGVVASARKASGATSPVDIPGCLLWLGADQITGVADGGIIPYWDDSSGNGRRFNQQAGGHTQPHLQMNVGGRNGPSVYLSVLERTNFMAGRTAAEMCLNVYCPVVGEHLLFEKTTFTASPEDSHWPYSDGQMYDAFGSTTRKTPGPLIPIGVWKAITVHSAPSDWGVHGTGGSLFQTATNTVGFPAAGSTIRLGHYYRTDMYVSDFIIYDHKLTASERAAVFTYLGRTP